MAIIHTTTELEKAYKAAVEPPKHRQLELAALLESAIQKPFEFSDTQAQSVKRGMDQADAGEFVSDNRINEILSK